MAYHVLPINDSEEHKESTSCKCKPVIKFENDEMIIIHNSFDGREYIEELINDAINNKN